MTRNVARDAGAATPPAELRQVERVFRPSGPAAILDDVPQRHGQPEVVEQCRMQALHLRTRVLDHLLQDLIDPGQWSRNSRSSATRTAMRDRSIRAAASIPATSLCRRRATRARSSSSLRCRCATSAAVSSGSDRFVLFLERVNSWNSPESTPPPAPVCLPLAAGFQGCRIVPTAPPRVSGAGVH